MRPGRNIVSFICAGILMLLGGCELLRPVGTEEPKPSEVTVQVEEGEQAELESFGASLAFIDKTSESRCPRVACVWAGEARIQVAFTPESRKAVRFELLIGGFTDAGSEDGYQRVDTMGYGFSLIELTPYPDAAVPQPDVRARATVRIKASTI